MRNLSAALDHSHFLHPRTHNPDISRARDLVLKYGWNSTSFQIVNPGIKRWFSPAADAVVGYVTASRVRVVVGAPVCAPPRLAAVAADFERNAADHREKVCYFAAESRLESVYANSNAHTKFLIGAQPVWQPAEWAESVANHRSLRAQFNRAANKGVVVTEWPRQKASDHPELIACLALWLDSKGLPPLHFMVEADTLNRIEHRRVFVAEREDSVVGFVVLSPVANRNGWLFEQFPHVPGAPNGTVELMIDKAMRTIAAEGSHYATLGLSPLSKRADVDPIPVSFWLRFLLGWLRKHGQRFYNFDGLDRFKAKLMPAYWEPVFAISNEPEFSGRTLYAIAQAFTENHPFRVLASGLKRAVFTEVKTFRRWIAG